RRRTRRRQHEAVTGEVYRSPLILPVTGWVCAGIGLLIGLMGLSLRGSDEDSLPMMIVGAVLLVLGALVVERGGAVAWFTEDALKYRKPFRGGTITYADIEIYHWMTPELARRLGRRRQSWSHMAITSSNGKKTRFNFAFQSHLDFSPLHQWAEAHHRQDLLPAAGPQAVSNFSSPATAIRSGETPGSPRLY